ncbi:hypothetical protein Vafri_27, partial [Volvox africanus]
NISHGGGIRGAASKWLPSLLTMIIMACGSGLTTEAQQNVTVPQVVTTLVFISDYWIQLLTRDKYIEGAWTLRPRNDRPFELAEENVALLGWSSNLPALYYEKEWPDNPFGYNFQDSDNFFEGSIANDEGFKPTLFVEPPSPRPPEKPPPPPLPPLPPLPPRKDVGNTMKNYSALDWRFTFRSAIRLLPGHRLAIKSMAFYTAGYTSGNALTGLVLSQLSFSPIGLPAGAVLELEDVVVILSCIELRLLQQTLCSSPDTLSYNPGVIIEDGVVRIANMTSQAPGPDNGVQGAGGQVHWRNITLTCPGFGLKTPRPCAARAVANGPELRSATRKAFVDESTTTVILSITEDVALQQTEDDM